MKKFFWAFIILFSSMSISHASSAASTSAEVELPHYSTLHPIVIPIIKAGKVYGYLRIEVQLETKDGSPIASIKPIFPILRDKYFTVLYGVLCDRWLPDTPLNQDTILELVKKATTSVLLERTKEDNLKVYFKNFYFTPANK